MNLLLDTHAFLWWVDGSQKLGPKARLAVADVESEVFVSIASCWEIAIKVSLGKLRLPTPLGRFLREQFEANGFSLLEVEFAHTVRVAALPFHHREPFDRLLTAQSLEERLAFVSVDPIFDVYGVQRLW